MSFRAYQQAFTAHIRAPQRAPRPRGVPANRMRIYREIVFNNLFNSVSACYPVLQGMLGKRQWKRLVRQYFADHPSPSPLFREIPLTFLQYLQSRPELPDYVAELAHYEWAELAVATADTPMPAYVQNGDLMHEYPILSPAAMLLHYRYPVHRLAPSHKPVTPQATDLLVFRRPDHAVGFTLLNPASAFLVKHLQSGASTGQEALVATADALGLGISADLQSYAEQLLAALQQQGAIWGLRRD